jgi:hypothetical protein
MLHLNNFIIEKLKISSKSKINNYNYFPKNKNELRELLKKLINERGKNADLNDIDTSKIKDMSYLFNGNIMGIENPDISKWDVSNVKDMSVMFCDCKNFDCDLSKWDVSKDISMKYMFDNCINFTGNGLDKWNIKNLKYTYEMLRKTKVPQNIIDKFINI